MTKVIYCEKKFDCNDLIGKFLDSSHYDHLLTEDTDVYAPSLHGDMTEENVVVRFRKNVFTQEELDLCYEGLITAASESQNRGMAAGPRGEVLHSASRGGREWVTPYQVAVLEFLTKAHNSFLDSESLESIKQKFADGGNAKEETRGNVWLRSEVCKEHDPYFGWFDRWVDSLKSKSEEVRIAEATYIRDNFISETNYAQTVISGVAGYYSRYPRIPYGRATSFTEKNPELFVKSFPFLNRLNNEFKNLLPQRWAAQRAAADKLDKRFLIDETVFTTLTVNHNWRTAAHLDAGDLGDGFSNLCTFGKGWKGAELILPEFRAAVDLRPGDLLLVANHTAIHSNAPLEAPAEGVEPDRMSLVAYFREDMLDCKSWDYESLRKQYVEERRSDKSHKFSRPLWNGVSPGMWEDKEWFDYMKKHNMVDPYGKSSAATLEDFFS
jgi:hypothetical protein